MLHLTKSRAHRFGVALVGTFALMCLSAVHPSPATAAPCGPFVDALVDELVQQASPDSREVDEASQIVADCARDYPNAHWDELRRRLDGARARAVPYRPAPFARIRSWLQGQRVARCFPYLVADLLTMPGEKYPTRTVVPPKPLLMTKTDRDRFAFPNDAYGSEPPSELRDATVYPARGGTTQANRVKVAIGYDRDATVVSFWRADPGLGILVAGFLPVSNAAGMAASVPRGLLTNRVVVYQSDRLARIPAVHRLQRCGYTAVRLIDKANAYDLIFDSSTNLLVGEVYGPAG